MPDTRITSEEQPGPTDNMRIFGSLSTGSVSEGERPSIVIAVGADKGSPEESESLRLFSAFVNLCIHAGLTFQTYERNTRYGNVADAIRISI